MATYSERGRRSLYAGKIAIAAGIFVLLVGLYFIFAISGETNRKNAECTEELERTDRRVSLLVIAEGKTQPVLCFTTEFP